MESGEVARMRSRLRPRSHRVGRVRRDAGRVLASIALGSAAIAPFMKRRRPWLTILAGGEVLIAVAVLMSFRALETVPAVVAFAGTVYSTEYFSLVRSGLRDGGLAVLCWE
jgi:hypothetical protein